MPITKSAKKALKQSLIKRERNLERKKKVKSSFKKIKKLVESKSFDEASKSLPEFFKSVDKAARTGVIKKNTAARRKSRVSLMISRESKS